MSKVPTALLLTATIISGVTMATINSMQVKAEASYDKNVFLEEVRKPDGSGYMFDGSDGVSISVDNITG